jgi:glucose-1-phosphate cytidylyltransferase
MKAIMLSGGRGTRLSEETLLKPTPMIEIGGKQAPRHIISDTAAAMFTVSYLLRLQGLYNQGVLCQLFSALSDVTFDMERNTMEVHHRRDESWRVKLIDIGEKPLAGGRLGRLADSALLPR